MAAELVEKGDGILEVRANGKLTREDYEHFVAEVERLIKQHGKIRVLFDMHDFHGWEAGALWEDICVDPGQFKDIKRLAIVSAIVGTKAWEHGITEFCRPFTTATIRYFDRAEAGQARAWLAGEE